MTEWTSRQRRDEEEPSVHELRTGDLRIIVHRFIGVSDVWFVSCPDICVDRRVLSSKDVELAKAESLSHIESRLNALLGSLLKTKAGAVS